MKGPEWTTVNWKLNRIRPSSSAMPEGGFGNGSAILKACTATASRKSTPLEAATRTSVSRPSGDSWMVSMVARLRTP